MVELTILDGPERGRVMTLSRFPARVGRRSEVEGSLTGPGVWDHHFSICEDENRRFKLVVEDGARVSVGGQFVEGISLRNGEVLGVGGLRLRFGLKVPEQRPLETRERAVWVMGAMILLFEGWIIHWVSR